MRTRPPQEIRDKPCPTGCGRLIMRKSKQCSSCHARSAAAARPRETTWKVVAQPNGCVLWAAGTNGRGYGSVNVSVNGKRQPLGAHVVAWQKLNGPVPRGMHLHHTCENTLCVNPDHLMPLTPEQHAAMHPHSSPWSVCKRGHPLPANVKGAPKKKCRICKAERRPYGTCADCGGKTNYKDGVACLRCRECTQRRVHERALHIVAWWTEGLSRLEIAQRLGWSDDHIRRELGELRQKGYDLPYRRQPRKAVAA